MTAQLVEFNHDQSDAEFKALCAASDAAYWAAKITTREDRAWKAVRSALAAVRGGWTARSPFAAHYRKLERHFGTADLAFLRRRHGKDPRVIGASRAALRKAGITAEQLAAFERVETVKRGDAGVFEPHAEQLRRLFGTTVRAEAQRAWHAREQAFINGLD